MRTSTGRRQSCFRREQMTATALKHVWELAREGTFLVDFEPHVFCEQKGKQTVMLVQIPTGDKHPVGSSGWTPQGPGTPGGGAIVLVRSQLLLSSQGQRQEPKADSSNTSTTEGVFWVRNAALCLVPCVAARQSGDLEDRPAIYGHSSHFFSREVWCPRGPHLPVQTGENPAQPCRPTHAREATHFLANTIPSFAKLPTFSNQKSRQ